MDLLNKFSANGRTFRDFTELTPESMEVFYMVAFNHYNAGKYEDAANVFRLLSARLTILRSSTGRGSRPVART